MPEWGFRPSFVAASSSRASNLGASSGRSKDQQYTQVPRHLRNWRLQAQQRQPEPENSQGFQRIPMDFKMEMGPKNTWAFQDWEAL